jgi:uncharacterized protein YbaR (Trm112 family)
MTVRTPGSPPPSDTLDPRLLAILVCPKCKGALTHRPAEQALDCPACKLRYAIRDGIPVMLIDEAAPLP